MLFFFSSRRRHTILTCDWSSDVCSSDLSMTTFALADLLVQANVVIEEPEPHHRRVQREAEAVRERGKIGRASCRERGKISVVAVSLKKKQSLANVSAFKNRISRVTKYDT